MRAEVEAAERLGISYKRMQGWEPRTIYEYDTDGRLVASRPEVEWDDTERAWMLSLAAWRTEHVCPLCGMPREICQAPETEFNLEVPLPTRCHVTTAIKRAQAARAKAPGEHDDALLWGAGLKP
ncbi:hypothetical protein GCM10027059_25790 [Myceligenerans halotolerans]